MELREEFLVSVSRGDAAAVQVLLERNPDLARVCDDRGTSALLVAAYRRHSDVVAVLLNSGLQLDIFEAAAVGQAERVQALVRDNPALANAYAPDGFTPLALASFLGHRPIVETLLEHGANPNLAAQNSMMVMPLHSAAASRQLDIARLLISHGAQPDARQTGGYSPLHEAANSGQTELALLLLEHGADPNSSADDGRTPWSIAVQQNRHEIVELLRRHGAKE